MQINNEDLFTLLLSTVRYSLGKRTFMSSEAGNLVMRYKACLTKHQLQQILDKVTKEITYHNTLKRINVFPPWLGDKCDIANWEDFARKLEELV